MSRPARRRTKPAANRPMVDLTRGTRPRHPKKDWDVLVAAAWRNGWSCTRTGSGHYLLKSPDGEGSVTLPATSSNRNYLDKMKGHLRRQGVTV